jgi:RNA polymerase sigma factor (sigma-70 family)
MELTDEQLLEKFLREHDERAFEDLVRRHAALVLGICRRILGNSPEAQDAFQNTFLVLIKKAHMIQFRSVRSWLYQVAVRTSLNVRKLKLVEKARAEKHMEEFSEMEEAPPVESEDLKPVLDEELSELSEKYRLPLVLCYFEGKSSEEAAEVLSLNYNTLKARLMRGREMLRKRLVRRGFALSASGLLACLTANANAQVTSEQGLENLITTTVRSASQELRTSGIFFGLTSLAQAAVRFVIAHKIAVVTGLLVVSMLGFSASRGIFQSTQVQSKPKTVQDDLTLWLGQKLNISLKDIHLENVPLRQAVDILVTESKRQDPLGEGLQINLIVDGQTAETRVNLHASEMRLNTAIFLIAKQANLERRMSPEKSLTLFGKKSQASK